MSLSPLVIFACSIGLAFSQQVVVEQVVNKWNIGGPDMADNSGFVWKGLPCPSGSVSYAVQDITNLPHPQYANLCYSATEMNFIFDVIQPGNYTVRLHFIDPNITGPGLRLFNIQINDDYLKMNLDVWKKVGLMKEYSIGYLVVSTDGKILVRETVTKRNCILSGVEIIRFNPYTFPPMNP